MSNPKTIINCKKNGSAKIEGNFILVFPNGEEKEFNGKASICRCGISKKMPFCDGRHKKLTTNYDKKF